jgi:hypothetical protein
VQNFNPGWDMPYLNKLLLPLWPENLDYMIYPIHVTDEEKLELVSKYAYDIHNALDDAMIMKKATLGH